MFDFVRRIYQGYLRSRKIGNDLPRLNTSFNPLHTIRRIRQRFSIPSLIQDSFLTIVILFSFYIMPLPIWGKLLFFSGLVSAILIPIFAQFFGYALPVLGWVFLFFTSRYIPLSMKEPITVSILPAVETIFYGDNLSQILASYTCTFLDIIAWIPYGLIHFAFPFIVAALIWIFAPPTTLRGFAWAFGFMNLVGVIIQDLLFPSAPPWYKVLHGLEKANYDMTGSSGGLGRIDVLLGFDLYSSNFKNSPLIFGAMPSLHSACSTMDCLWLCYLFPSWSPLWYFYVLWLWFSTMYLTHHYFIDLVVGSCLAVAFFGIVKVSGNLPINDKFCRWSYESIRYYDPEAADPLRNTLENDVPLETFSGEPIEEAIEDAAPSSLIRDSDQFVIDDEDTDGGDMFELPERSFDDEALLETRPESEARPVPLSASG
ncbi:DEKNAAC100697 [Brettanomyces naardenensis]|uniref:DEKNAAC100697 n=1 Tax=Brettanomyces naardenensis TaxID=13370 RepID=A0A448YEK3_BRENA|nr:DEKNAAC100697 [Brettanomyces naardenensis]